MKIRSIIENQESYSVSYVNKDGQEVEFMKGMTLRQADDKVYKLVRGIRQWGNDPSKLNFDNQPMSPERVILKKNGQAIPHGYKGNEQKPITGELGENEASMKGMYIPNTSNPVYEKMRKFLKFAQEQGFTDVKHLLDNNTFDMLVSRLAQTGVDLTDSKETAGEPITEEQFDQLAEKQDACYHKVKSRYDVWPSAYASGALVKCRKVGAKNWGNSSKKKKSKKK
jgi:hypothetical protein